MAAIVPTEKPYSKNTPFDLFKSRIPWLLILMLSATITGTVLAKYEAAFEALPLLISFIPMIMGTAGNSGQQSSTIVIRALATEEITLKDWLKVLWKEFRVAIGVGTILALANGVRIYLQYNHDIKLALVVGITLILTSIMAKVLRRTSSYVCKKTKIRPSNHGVSTNYNNR